MEAEEGFRIKTFNFLHVCICIHTHKCVSLTVEKSEDKIWRHSLLSRESRCRTKVTKLASSPMRPPAWPRVMFKSGVLLYTCACLLHLELQWTKQVFKLIWIFSLVWILKLWSPINFYFDFHITKLRGKLITQLHTLSSLSLGRAPMTSSGKPSLLDPLIPDFVPSQSLNHCQVLGPSGDLYQMPFLLSVTNLHYIQLHAFLIWDI